MERAPESACRGFRWLSAMPIHAALENLHPAPHVVSSEGRQSMLPIEIKEV